MNKKGVVLFFVLGVLFIVILLANIVLNLVSSQSRLANHQVNRVQAYYAAQAGVNYALEQLRLNTFWVPVPQGTRRICGSAYSLTCTGNNFTEGSFPPSVNYVDISIGPVDPISGSRTIHATVNYTSAF